MMGVKRWQLWFAKFFDAMWPLSIIGFTVVLLLHVSFSETEASLQVVKPIDSSIVFLLGTIAIVAFLFFLSSIFKNGKSYIISKKNVKMKNQWWSKKFFWTSPGFVLQLAIVCLNIPFLL